MNETPETLLKAVDDFDRCPTCHAWDYENGRRKHHAWCTIALCASAWEAERDALRTRMERVRADVYWMLNNGKLLNPEVFEYLDTPDAESSNLSASPSTAQE